MRALLVYGAFFFLQNGDREKEKNCGRWKENEMLSK
jgi:hypothetical protein